ncbi:MAG: pantoate--beta-alanine ligase [Nocardioidaceae bacterium]|nr:pantoate--beta-alanine ligase [Nocardioidaceae bacterium]
MTTRAALQVGLREHGAGSARVALVPTMGALHAGHVALFDEARTRGDVLVVSIFVNPMQFGPSEDLAAYPRSLDADLEICDENGVDLVFAPDLDTVYPGGLPQVTIEPGAVATILDGASRPGHFRGVLTVVAKLFGLVQPAIAVFGEKDYQQLVLIRRMAADLCLATEIVGGETVRDPDGLALSSRNRYLSAADRASALALSRALRAGQAAGAGGPDDVLVAAGAVLAVEPGLAVDYLALRATDLGEAPETGDARLLVAARVGTTRLIDNVAVRLQDRRLSSAMQP